MFRSSSELPNPLDPAIKKATSETLTQDNWEFILDACDQISADPEDGAHNAIQAIEKRLKLKDGNVLLRTLSLITAAAENCGSKMKQEIATKRFCNILKDLISDRSTYLPIKYKIVEMIDQLSKSFAKDPSLRIVSDTYKDIKLSYPDLVTNYKPAKPQKHEMTNSDRIKEEEELDLALKLSLQEYESKQGRSTQQQSVGAPQQPAQQVAQQEPQQETQQNANVPVSENNKSNIATVSRVKALYDLSSYEPDELSFKKGDVITVIESVYRDWWRGSLRGKIGIFPLNYVTPLKEPTTEELMAELKAEHTLLTKTNEVEKLLSLLSNFSSRLLNNKVSNEELSSMVQDDQLSAFYKDVVSLRPQLAKLIEKYSTKKDEMIALNEKLVDSERLYNELMENSFNRFMNTRAQQQQQQHYAQVQPQSQQQQQQQQPPHQFQPQLQNQFLGQVQRANQAQVQQPQRFDPAVAQANYPPAPHQGYDQQQRQQYPTQTASSSSSFSVPAHPQSNPAYAQANQQHAPAQRPQQTSAYPVPQDKISRPQQPPQQQHHHQPYSTPPLQQQHSPYPARPQAVQQIPSAGSGSGPGSPYAATRPPTQSSNSGTMPPYPSYGI